MKQSLAVRIVVPGTALVLAGVHVWRPEVRIDSITVVLLVIVALPWLQPLIKSIELLGVKLELQEFKLELQELRNKAAEAQGAAESATQQAGLALASSAGPPADPPGEGAGADADAIKSLAEEYNRIRDKQQAGNARTRAMTAVVQQMIDLAARAMLFDATTALRDANRGVRLFAYAYLYRRPDSGMLLPLIDSVTVVEDRPFGQYWGLQAIACVLAEAPRELLPQVRMRLLTFAAKLPAGTDRAYEVKKLLRQLEQSDQD